MSDPLRSKVRRAARFLRDAGVLENLRPFAGPGVARVVARGGLNVKTIHAVHARQVPERVAIVDARTALTYAEVDRALNRIARALASIGIQRGARIILCMENRAEYLLFWFAGFRSGVATVHASYRSTPEELAYLADHSNARAIVCSSKTAPAVRGLLELGHKLEVVVVDDVALTPRQHAYPDWARPFPDDLFEPGRDARGDNVVYTSGTTGKPKGAVRNFTNAGIFEISRIGERLPIRAGERHLVVSPLYHSGAQAFVAMMTSLGASIYLREHFDPEDALDALSRWCIHSVFMVPTMIQRVLDVEPEVDTRYPTPCLRALVCGAAPFPDALRRRAIDRFGAGNLFDFYGATELGWITLINGTEMLERPGSVGRPLSGHELCIRDSAHRELPAGEVGTIWVRTEQTMEGYINDSGDTDDPTNEGWITVDDLGFLDEDGYLYLAGRDRDMVISGGVNIYPVEIEEVLCHHPDVRDVAVIGVPDPEWGEKLVGFVVGGAPVDELERYGRERLASFKVPREWVFVDELPRNPTGKVLKRELRERLH